VIAAARHYIQEHDNQLPLWRIDFIAIELDNKGKPLRIELIENAIAKN